MLLLAIPFPQIDPIAIAIGPIAIRWYALAYVAGLAGGWWYARRLVSEAPLWGAVRRPTPNDVDDLVIWLALGVVLGGRIGYVLFYNLGSYLETPLDILKIWEGGMSFHGGLLGAIAAVWLFSRSRRLGFLSVMDLAATVAPIGLLTGRIANFVNGELWGRPSDVPWAMVFPGAGPLPRHPSQLYEAFAEGLLLLLILAWAARRFGFGRPGLLAGLFASGYAVARIACEFFREPDEQLGFLFAGATMGQLLSLPLLAVGLALSWAAFRGRTAARAAPTPAGA